MIQGLIWDLDGTLLDTMDRWDTLGGDYLRSLGYTPRPGIDGDFRTFTVEQAAEYYIAQYGVPMSKEALVDGIHRAVEDIYRKTAPAREGVPAFLRELRDAGVQMAMATATDRALTEAALVRLGLDGYFVGIVTCAEVGAGKTQPEVYRAALNLLGTERDKTMVAEDAVHAAETAARDGFPVLGVAESHEPGQAAFQAVSRVYLPDFRHTDSFWTIAASL